MDGSMKVFISHSERDRDTAERLKAALEQNGIGIVSFDDLAPGDAINEHIVDAIENSDAVLVLISEASSKSPWVASEIALALSSKLRNNKPIIPLLLERGVEVPFFLRNVLYLDFSRPEDLETNVARLVASLKRSRTDRKESSERERAEVGYLEGSHMMLELDEAEMRMKKMSLTYAMMLSLVMAMTVSVVVMVPLFQPKFNSDSFGRIILPLACFALGIVIGVLTSTLLTSKRRAMDKIDYALGIRGHEGFMTESKSDFKSAKLGGGDGD